MPSKKRKYNARFPAGRIKKIMQTDEEVGKVAQAVPIIISRTLELFVESLLKKALQVTSARNAKTLSPSHVKQCILAETRFDFLRDLVKNIPDVSAAEERELMSAETSPNTSRFPDAPRKVAREDSNSSSSGDVTRSQPITSNVTTSREHLKRALSTETEIPFKVIRTEPGTSIIIDPLAPSTSVKIEPYPLVPSTSVKIEPLIAGITVHNDAPMDLHMSPVLAKIKHRILSKDLPPLKIVEDTAIDLSKKDTPRTANFYQETLVDDASHSSVIKVNPTYLTPQPSTSFTTLTPVDTRRKVEFPFERHNSIPRTPATPKTPITPVINIDFSKNLARPEIKVLDAATSTELTSALKNEKKQVSRQNSKSRIEVKKIEAKPVPIPVDIDSLNSGNLQIDEDYDA